MSSMFKKNTNYEGLKSFFSVLFVYIATTSYLSFRWATSFLELSLYYGIGLALSLFVDFLSVVPFLLASYAAVLLVRIPIRNKKIPYFMLENIFWTALGIIFLALLNLLLIVVEMFVASLYWPGGS